MSVLSGYLSVCLYVCMYVPLSFCFSASAFSLENKYVQLGKIHIRIYFVEYRLFRYNLLKRYISGQ